VKTAISNADFHFELTDSPTRGPDDRSSACRM
jgi:hypothetical protein